MRTSRLAVVVVLVGLTPGCKAGDNKAEPPAGEPEPTLRDEAARMAEIAAQSSSSRHEARARRAKKLAERAKSKRAHHRRALRAARHFDAAAQAAAEAKSHALAEPKKSQGERVNAAVSAGTPVDTTQTKHVPKDAGNPQPDSVPPVDDKPKTEGEPKPDGESQTGDDKEETAKPEARPEG